VAASIAQEVCPSAQALPQAVNQFLARHGSNSPEETFPLGKICHRLATASLPLEKFAVESIHLKHQHLETEILDDELPRASRHLPRQAMFPQKL
jgi:hypothetical protein